MMNLELLDDSGSLLKDLDIRIFNDIHLEFDNSFKIPNIKKNQVIILAGDIGRQGSKSSDLNNDLKDFFYDILNQGAIILFVAGNHEYYGSRIEKFNNLVLEFENKNNNFFFLNDKSVFINGFEFIGGTLWTSFNNKNFLIYTEIGGDKKYGGKTSNTSNDYFKIKNKSEKDGIKRFGKFQTKDAYLLHIKTVKYIKSRINKNKKQIVITHFAPSEIFLDKERWSSHKKNGYDYDISKYNYYTELECLAENFSCWIAGHTHKYVNEIKNGVHYISIPRGYRTEKEKFMSDRYSLIFKASELT